MRITYVAWSYKRLQGALPCKHTKDMKCVPLRDDHKCYACYEEYMRKQNISRAYMYGRFAPHSRTLTVLHLIKATGRTVCGLHGSIIRYMVYPDGQVCMSCQDALNDYRELKRKNSLRRTASYSAPVHTLAQPTPPSSTGEDLSIWQ